MPDGGPSVLPADTNMESFESWRSVTLPEESILSVRTRKCVLATGEPGWAPSRASKAARGVIDPRARFSWDASGPPQSGAVPGVGRWRSS
jgi:hypothetical protein